MAEKKTVSLADLNVQEKCAEGIEFELTTPAGKGMGVFVTVLGGHAPSVQKWVNRQINQRRAAEAIQAKRGKNDVRPIEDDIDFGVEAISIRVTAWRGISEEFTPENALKLCTINPLIRDQIKDFSENIENFTKG